MISEVSARLGLPLLVPGQGQKDVTHNEALVLLDILVQPVVQSASVAVPPEAVMEGMCWLVPQNASGIWGNRAGAMACWTAGGWRFVEASEGWIVWVVDQGVAMRHQQGAWQQVTTAGTPVVSPAGGSVVDVEARGAIDAILDRLVSAGVIAPFAG